MSATASLLNYLNMFNAIQSINYTLPRKIQSSHVIKCLRGISPTLYRILGSNTILQYAYKFPVKFNFVADGNKPWPAVIMYPRVDPISMIMLTHGKEMVIFRVCSPFLAAVPVLLVDIV